MRICAYIDPQNHPNVGIYGSPIGRVWGPDTTDHGLIWSVMKKGSPSTLGPPTSPVHNRVGPTTSEGSSLRRRRSLATVLAAADADEGVTPAA